MGEGVKAITECAMLPYCIYDHAESICDFCHCFGRRSVEGDLTVNEVEEEFREASVCDDCDSGDYWECHFCCSKCYEDYGKCPDPECDPWDI